MPQPSPQVPEPDIEPNQFTPTFILLVILGIVTLAAAIYVFVLNP